MNYNTQKLLDLAQRFRLLEKQQKDLDFRRGVWAREARAAFDSEQQFTDWCAVDLGLTVAQSKELLFRARCAEIVPDAEQWTKLGGLRQIRAVEGLTKKQQVAALEAAKASGRSVRAIVAERHPIQPPATPDIAPEPIRRSADMRDAATLAKYIASVEHRLGKLPSDIEVIVRMYAPAQRRKVA